MVPRAKFIILLFLISCTPNKKEAVENPLAMVPNPVNQNSGEPYLFTDRNQQVYLSWIEQNESTGNKLLFSKLDGEGWTNPKAIANGNNWFVNWADFPTITANDNFLLAHYLAKSGPESYAYDIRVASSADAGKTWSDAFVLHDDGTKTEHGFVTAVPYNDGFFVTWLDGRNTKGHDHGAMNIRGAFINQSGDKVDDQLLDAKVCDCCQTGAAITDNGPIVVYRDRSNFEVRDISIVRYVDGSWTEPAPVAKDGWEIKGCPVNGPKADAIGQLVAVAWFTAAKGMPQVNLVFSNDSGKSFGPPIRIDDGNPLGRVDLVLADKSNAYVSWLETHDENGQIKLRKVNADGSFEPSVTISDTSTSRASGFPQMTKGKDHLFFAWTTTEDTRTVKTASYQLN